MECDIEITNDTDAVANDGPSVQHFVTLYLSFTKKSAETIIPLSSTLLEAEATLEAEKFNLFCSEVKIEKGKSHHKKLRAIGRQSKRFHRVLDKLPSCWTTLYKLAALEDAEFETLVDGDVISPFMTARAIDEHLVTSTKKKRRTSAIQPMKIIIIYSSLGAEEQSEIMATLNDWKKRWDLDVNSNYGAFAEDEDDTICEEE